MCAAVSLSLYAVYFSERQYAICILELCQDNGDTTGSNDFECLVYQGILRKYCRWIYCCSNRCILIHITCLYDADRIFESSAKCGADATELGINQYVIRENDGRYSRNYVELSSSSTDDDRKNSGIWRWLKFWREIWLWRSYWIKSKSRPVYRECTWSYKSSTR